MRLAMGALAGWMLTLPVWALNIGDPYGVSALSQPLRFSFDVEHPRTPADQIRVVVRPIGDGGAVLDPTELELTTQAADGRTRVNVLTRQPIAEPIVDLRIRVISPTMQLIRDVPLLLDLPADPAPGQVLGRRAQASAARSPSARQPAERPPTARSTPPTTTADGPRYGPVGPGETLSQIAARTRPDATVPLPAATRALLAANPALAGDPRNLRMGAMLRLPRGYRAVPASPVPTRAQPAPSTRPPTASGRQAQVIVGTPAPPPARFALSRSLDPAFLVPAMAGVTRPEAPTTDASPTDAPPTRATGDTASVRPASPGADSTANARPPALAATTDATRPTDITPATGRLAATSLPTRAADTGPDWLWRWLVPVLMLLLGLGIGVALMRARSAGVTHTRQPPRVLEARSRTDAGTSSDAGPSRAGQPESVISTTADAGQTPPDGADEPTRVVPLRPVSGIAEPVLEDTGTFMAAQTDAHQLLRQRLGRLERQSGRMEASDVNQLQLAMAYLDMGNADMAAQLAGELETSVPVAAAGHRPPKSVSS